MSQKTLFLLLIGCAGIVLCDAARAEEPLNVKIMTFNIRYENDTDGANRWSLRRELATDVIRRFDGDFVGLQEAMPGQIADLSKMLPEYPITADVTFLQD